MTCSLHLVVRNDSKIVPSGSVGRSIAATQTILLLHLSALGGCKKKGKEKKRKKKRELILHLG